MEIDLKELRNLISSYSWIDKIITNGVAKTSIALFAPNFTFNYATFSTFNTDSSAYNAFYSSERKIFSGVDQDPFNVDSTWKGIGNYIPVRSNIISLPFQTDFNTGHGFNYYDNGNILISGSWSNISHQSPLPSWTFYANSLSINYDFNTAFSGGSSLSIVAAATGSYTIPLYSTEMVTISDRLNIELALKSSSNTIDSVSVELRKKNSITPVVSSFYPSLSGNWEVLTNNDFNVAVSDTLIEILLHISSSGPFSLHLGKINIESTSGTQIQPLLLKSNSLVVYPNPSEGVVSVSYDGNEAGQLHIYDLQGRYVFTKTILRGEIQSFTLPNNNVYTYEFRAGKVSRFGKLIVY